MFRLLALLLIPVGLGAQNTDSAASPGSVGGRVTDSQTGIGIGGAVLHLFLRSNAGNRGSPPPAATSLDDGTFHFESVAPGSYILWVTHPTYVSNAAIGQSLTVQAGQSVSNVAVHLQPLGAIEGRVLDDAGHPVARATVQLFSTYNYRGRNEPRRVKTSTSDALGKYLFEKVGPGRYYISADPPSAKTAKSKPGNELPGLKPIRTFYPKTLSFDEAGVIEITSPGGISEADIRLQHAATFHVRGKIESLGTGGMPKAETLTLGPRDAPAMGGLGRTAHTEPDGSFDIGDVPSGNYTLWLFGIYPGGSDQTRRGERRRLLARQDVEVSGGDTNGVLVSLLPPVNLSGRVILANPPVNASASQLRVALVPAGPSAPGSYQNLAVDNGGAFAIQDLEPGEYMVRVTNAPAGTYVHSITLNRQDVMTNGMDLSQGGGGELEIMLHSGAAEIDGTLFATNDRPQTASGTALLVPEILPVDGSGILSATIKAGGIFSIPNIPPGRYFAFAVERWSSIWQNPEFLQSIEREGTPVQVEENGHGQIQLSMLSAAQLQETASRLGLTVQ